MGRSAIWLWHLRPQTFLKIPGNEELYSHMAIYTLDELAHLGMAAFGLVRAFDTARSGCEPAARQGCLGL
jgi:hypothetical protein